MSKMSENESLAYHAARLLILIEHCGKPQKSPVSPGVEGRTLLAKLDFFLRYPNYLEKAARILNKESIYLKAIKGEDDTSQTVESKMVRYRYGPWDFTYYPVLAYLVGKKLINIDTKSNTEIFRITPQGEEIVKALAESDEYDDLLKRANAVYKLFNTYKGNRLKDFIYDNFPDVVQRKIGETIDPLKNILEDND